MDVRSILIFAVVIIVLVWLIMRLRGSGHNPPKLQMAMDMISALNDDLKIMRQKEASPEDLKKFKISNWKVYQQHLEFLDKDYIEAVKNAFNLMQDYNAKLLEMRVKSDNSKPQVDMENLKASAIKARAGLAKWIQENVNREATKGLFSWRN